MIVCRSLSAASTDRNILGISIIILQTLGAGSPHQKKEKHTIFDSFIFLSY